MRIGVQATSIRITGPDAGHSRRNARGSVSRVLSSPRGWATIPLRRRLRAASSNQPGQRVETHPGTARVPCRPYSVLLPVGFTMPLPLPVARCALAAPFHRGVAEAVAVCSLWHCPWGRPRRALPGTVVSWSPDFPRAAKAARGRPILWRRASLAAMAAPANHQSSPCGRGNSSASRIMRHSASISPSISSGRNRRWNAMIAAIRSATSYPNRSSARQNPA